MSANKNDQDKPRLDLLSRTALEELGRVLGHGADKYQPGNWRKGMKWSRLYAAALRHLLASMDGETLDPETGLSHTAHAMANMMFLVEYQKRGLGDDDRKNI